MKRFLISGAALLVLAAGLSACSGGGGGGATVTPPSASARIEDQLGTGFGVDFRASPNSDPRDLAANDVIPVNPAADPIWFPGT